MTLSLTRRKLAALPIVGLLAAAPVAGAQDAPTPKPPRVTETFQTQQTWTLKPNAEQTFSVRVKGLTAARDSAILAPCWGFAITGRGINLPIGEPDYYGQVTPEPGHENTDNGGIPGAERQSDGTFVVPESNATVGAYQIRRGLDCQARGWSWNAGTSARAARKTSKARRAQAGSVRVELAGLHILADGSELVLRVRTGSVPAGTKVKAFATTNKFEG